MSELKRYDPAQPMSMDAVPHGEWVRYNDAAAVIAQRDQMLGNQWAAHLDELAEQVAEARRDERERTEMVLRVLTRWSDGTEVDEVDAAVLARAADEVSMSKQPLPEEASDE
jgi:hypothetical protein